jgi:hypothetical protein
VQAQETAGFIRNYVVAGAGIVVAPRHLRLLAPFILTDRKGLEG